MVQHVHVHVNVVPVGLPDGLGRAPPVRKVDDKLPLGKDREGVSHVLGLGDVLDLVFAVPGETLIVEGCGTGAPPNDHVGFVPGGSEATDLSGTTLQFFAAVVVIFSL